MTEPAPSVNDAAPGPPASAAAPPPAVVFDVDGTLLDTVYLHVMAWWEAFDEAGHAVSCYDIHRTIGRGSSDLVERLIGTPDESLVQAHSDKWKPLLDRCRPFHQVPELLRHCAERGLTVVWATSGSSSDAERFQEIVGCQDAVSAVVNSEDIADSKPAPDIVLAALEKAGVPAERAVMVGDTVYDVEAARAAGVACIGVLAGGISEAEMREAGAAAVYGNPAELLEHFDSSPLGALLR
jgi:phosphoglycolate phosphatase-like HAD superfamily hydrolase